MLINIDLTVNYSDFSLCTAPRAATPLITYRVFILTLFFRVITPMHELIGSGDFEI